MELSVGDTVQIGNRILTVVDVDDEGISFRIDPIDSEFPFLSDAELLCQQPTEALSGR